MERLFDECAAALQCPWYFGENVDAFDKSIADLGWLPPESGYVIVICDPGEVLIDPDSDALRRVVDSPRRASDEWSRPVDQGEWWDRQAVPFHVALQATRGDAPAVVARCTAAGASVQPFSD